MLGTKLIGELRLDGLPKMTNSGGRSHWSVKVKEAREWHQTVYLLCDELKIKDLNLSKAYLTLTRYSSKEPDFDGLVSGFKHVIDGLVKARVIIDDKPSNIGSPKFLWSPVPRGKGYLTVKIEV